ncbi:hypothetical protein G9F72_018885 [Clostridium estertheticum]|uniref:hypothetical protein n=1 Tax=Clostridium estertheticum TaxID=238834 RepID=UPI0013E963DE|nr:hypothetical protein [Clostridium estertheticum]MBZ9688399.1 hypothetical protein [Clostridium estertheticum]
MEILVINNNRTTMNWEYKSPSRKHAECLEEFAKKINSDTKLKKMTIFVLGSLLYCKTTLAVVNPLDKVNKAGNMMLGISRTIGYWLILIVCICEIIKSLMAGDTKSISKIIMKNLLAFASLYLFPWLMDLVKGIFA